MRIKGSHLCVAVASMLVASRGALGQGVSVGVSAGASFPVGSNADVLEPGYHLAAHVGTQGRPGPIALRLDVAYDRWELEDFLANVNSISGTLNAVFYLVGNPVARARPYVLGGPGVYHLRGGFDFNTVGSSLSESATHFGLNGGLGVDFTLGQLAPFVEARYHSVYTEGENLSFVPVTFGVRF